MLLNQGKIMDDNYEQIFNGTLSEQKKVLNILEQNMKNMKTIPRPRFSHL